MRSAPRIAQCRQRPAGAFRDQLANFPFEPAGMLAQAFAIIVRRDFFQRPVEQSRQRLHRLVAALAHKHERKIVAQRCEIAIAGKQRGPQFATGQRIALALGHPADEMKRNVGLMFC